MAFTCGFYNSKNHDRRYDARQLSSIFDGVILDGVYMSIGDRFMVKANGTDMMITVGTGRAWFNHTWSLNDAPYPIEVPQSEVILKRIDAVVLEVNEETTVRGNRLFVLKGTPSSQPVRPTLANTNSLHQYALAYINVDANVTLIRQADITYVVGQTPTPFVTSPLEGMNIDDLVAQWQDQWTKFFSDETKRWENFYTTQTAEMLKTATDWETLWETWFNDYTTSNTQDIANWKQITKAEFMEWWNELQVMLDGDVAGNLSTAVIALQKKVTGLETFRHDLLYDKAIYDPILDSDGEPVLDSDGNPVGGRVIFVTEPEFGNFQHTFEAFSKDIENGLYALEKSDDYIYKKLLNISGNPPFINLINAWDKQMTSGSTYLFYIFSVNDTGEGKLGDSIPYGYTVVSYDWSTSSPYVYIELGQPSWVRIVCTQTGQYSFEFRRFCVRMDLLNTINNYKGLITV